MPLWLSESDVRAVLSLSDLIPAMESALAAFSGGAVDQPVRTAIELRPRSFFGLMPAYHREASALGAKLVSVAPENAARSLPTHLAAISLFDPETGELLAVMDGRYITELRTAAVSAISVKLLARADAEVLAILGSGVQARSHVEALRLVRPFREIRAWSPTVAHLHEFAAECHVTAASSAAEAVCGAGVVLLATNMVTPAIDNGWVAVGAHAIAIGACRPSQREIDPALVARARLFVDSRAAALQESGDIVQAIREGRIAENHIEAELGDVIAGRARGRTSPDELTLFKSLGLAIEDVAAAALVYRRARESGRGIELSL
jgi:ornithine cyclodeaminase/alanine dehydrogenase-like protein (mu-crystallin family)